jgi:hypothetical protein
MPITIKLTVEDEDLAKVIAALTGGSAPALTTKSDPPPVSDGKKGKAAAKPAAAPPAEAPAAEEPAAEEPAAEEEATTDLVTEKQKEGAAETAAQTELDDIRGQLTDYYVGQGSSKKEVQNAIAGMSEEELRAAYLDYLARLVVDATGEFTADFETPYLAARINDGKEANAWIKGGVTLTPEQCAELKLADPNAKAAAAAPKKPGLPMRKGK